jgi:uncharacterized protein YjiS (DUF1127 family)
MAYATDTRSIGGTIAERIGRLRAAMADRYGRYALYKRTLGELQALSDRDLADLGVARADIETLARMAARGD